MSFYLLDTHNVAAEGRGGTKTQGWTLIMQQFFAIIIKRFVYIRRNWKGLFSQVSINESVFYSGHEMKVPNIYLYK